METPDFASRTDIRFMLLDLSDSIARIAQTSQQLSLQQRTTTKKVGSLEAEMLKQMQELHRLHELQQLQLHELKQSQQSAVVDDSVLHFKQEQSADIQRQIQELRLMSTSQREEQIEMRQRMDKLCQQQVSVPGDEQTHVSHSRQEPLSMASVLYVVDGQEHHEERLEESIWTSAFFIGGPLLDHGGSLVSMVLLLLNICIQLFFSGIIANKFTDDSFHPHSVLAFEKWRKTIAHDYRHIDPITGASLASRVCETSQGKSLSISTEQYNTIDMIRSYLPDTNRNLLEQVLSGPTMCVIALVVWFSSIIKEVQQLVILVCSVSMAPTSTSMAYGIVDGQLEIRSVKFIRKLFIYFIVGVRAFILVILCVYGTQYVVYTVSVQDLLLNCVALTFVLDVDELLCGAFAPSRLLQIIRSVLPLKRRKVPSYRGADAMSIVCLSGVLTAVALISVTCLIPLVDRISMSKDHLCSGALDFVYTKSASGRMFFSTSRDFESSHDVFKSYEEQFVDGILRTSRDAYSYNNGFVLSMAQMLSISNQAIQDAFENCLDRLEGIEIHQRIFQSQAHQFLTQGTAPLAFLRAGGLTAGDLLNMSSLRCEPLRWLCKQLGDIGLRMRMFCPQTCRCDDPRRFVVDRRPEKGCDDSCSVIAERSAIRGDEGKTFCKDSRVGSIRSHVFTKELGEYKQRTQSLHLSQSQNGFLFQFYELLHEYGCEAIPKFNHMHNASVCTHNVFEIVMQQQCPEACGCGRSWPLAPTMRQCPRVCLTKLIKHQIMSTVGGDSGINLGGIGGGAASASGNQEREQKGTSTQALMLPMTTTPNMNIAGPEVIGANSNVDDVIANSTSVTTTTSTSVGAREGSRGAGILGRHRRRR